MKPYAYTSLNSIQKKFHDIFCSRCAGQCQTDHNIFYMVALYLMKSGSHLEFYLAGWEKAPAQQGDGYYWPNFIPKKVVFKDKHNGNKNFRAFRCYNRERPEDLHDTANRTNENLPLFKMFQELVINIGELQRKLPEQLRNDLKIPFAVTKEEKRVGLTEEQREQGNL